MGWTLICMLMVVCVEHLEGQHNGFQEYTIVSDTMPDDVRFRPPIGNGHVATNVFSDAVYMNGLYNGRGDRSSRARIPSFVNVDVSVVPGVTFNETYTLDMYNGIFTKEVQSQAMTITIITFAHRKYPQLLVTQLGVERFDKFDENITVRLKYDFGDESADFTWLHQQFKELTIANRTTQYRYGRIREPELPDATPKSLHVFHSVIPDTIELPSGTHSVLISYVASHSTDHQDALLSYRKALHHSSNDLLTLHKQEWNALWDEGRIDIYGNDDLSTDIAAATYNILCSLPSADIPDTFYGLGPGGLSRGGLLYPDRPGGPRNDYAGHMFWDMDTWVMPSIMMFHPAMTRQMIGARTRVLDQAKLNAKISGYKGAKFPWEQASTGIEATPTWAGNMSLYEIHVTADVAYGLRQYLYATDDVSLLINGRGLEMAIEIARFWKSRATVTQNNTVEILGVMGPDEYHFNVNNSVFTNYNAKLSLTLPRDIINNYKLNINRTVQEEFDTFVGIANNILIPFDDVNKFHPQYQDFNLSVPIKQSDVVLLGYPLMMPMSKEVRRNDLDLYERITDTQGPDTGTWSMHTVGWLELGDNQRAHTNFRKMFRNINKPFKVFSEKPVTNQSYGGCVNFITGAGGLLQSIVFGYGGLRIHPDRLEIHPKPLYNTTSWRLKGIHYKGAVIDIVVLGDSVSVRVRDLTRDSRATIDAIDIGSNELNLNDTFTFQSQIANLRIHPANDSNNHLTSNSASGHPAAASSAAVLIIYDFMFLLIINLKCNLLKIKNLL